MDLEAEQATKKGLWSILGFHLANVWNDSRMKILVLTKRQYMAKDLIDDRFGRFWELPLELARLGHEVRGLALSYRPRAEGKFTQSDKAAKDVTWTSVNLMRGFLPQIERYARRALEAARAFRPHVIWVCSDAYHAIFGQWLAERVQACCVIDLYDNFEAYRASQFPGVLPLFRRAVKSADGVSAFSRRLAEHVTLNYMRSKPTTVIENGIRPDLFYPRNRNECRSALGLAQDVRIIGTAGALDSSRGIEALLDSFETLSAEIPDLHLALAGPRPRSVRIPRGPRVHDLGVLSHDTVPLFVNCLDVAVISYRDSAQGEYSFPQKAYEIIACRVPLVAAAVGTMNELLGGYSDCLYEPQNSASLGAAIQRQLNSMVIVEIPVPSWADCAKRLGNFFLRIAHDDFPTVAQNSTK
jgi:teichuronic acid biosynthesis glycosyltransferase TuaC